MSGGVAMAQRVKGSPWPTGSESRAQPGARQELAVAPLFPGQRYSGGAPGYEWGSGDGPEGERLALANRIGKPCPAGATPGTSRSTSVPRPEVLRGGSGV